MAGDTHRITPLRYWRLNRSNGTSEVVYGERAYVTDNVHYYIRKQEEGWVITQLFAPHSIWQQIMQTGLPNATFARRRDAVEALETTLEAVG